MSDGDSIKVFLRVRPLNTYEEANDRCSCLDVDSDNNRLALRSTQAEKKQFTFDHVAPLDVTQETVFSIVGKDIVESCLSGYNGTVFAYGQTGSGKTFTMLGPAGDDDVNANFQHQLRGVVPRTFEQLFTLVERERAMNGDNVEFLLKCSFIEIYNEQVYDLLDAACSSRQLRENIKHGVFVDNVVEQVVTTATQAYEVLSAGWVNRTVASTSMNRESSRSHAVFTLSIESKRQENGVWKIKTSHLNLVDLAGSERQKDTNTLGIRLKEAGSINRSLSILGNVITALVDIAHKKTRHVPYRDSRLTFLLRDSLGGNAKTCIIACVHAGSRSFGETLSTLNFAKRAKMIKNKAVVNEDSHGSVAVLQAEIRRLKESLALYEAGNIPRQPNDPEGEVCVPADGIQNTAENSTYKMSFLQAMRLREKVLVDLKLSNAKYKRLEEAFSRKDQALRQNKMVLKFREETIKKLEKTVKVGEAVGDQKLQEVVSNYREEIAALQRAYDHHPDVAKVVSERDNLKAELNRMRNEVCAESLERDRARTAELEQQFAEAMKEQQGETPMPQTTPQSEAVSERQKSQITKLQEQLEAMKQQQREERAAQERQLAEREAELAALRTGRAELEKALSAQQTVARIEKMNLEERHNDTIRTITTPKRTRYQLRNRNVVVPGSGGIPLDLEADVEDTSADPITEGSLEEEPMPQELTEERITTLLAEIKTLQDENRASKLQINEQSSELLQNVETVTKLKLQCEQMEKLLSTEKEKLSSQEKALSDSAKAKENAVKAKQLLDEETEDLRVQTKSYEKQLRDVREANAARESEVAAMQIRLLQLEAEAARLQQAYEQGEREGQELRDALEVAQTTAIHFEDQLQETERRAEEGERSLQQAAAHAQTLLRKLEAEKERNQELESHLDKHTGDKEAELTLLRERLHGVEQRLQDEEQRTAESDVTHQQMQQEHNKLRHQYTAADKLNVELKDAVATLMQKVSDQQAQLADSDVTEQALREAAARVEPLEAAMAAMETRLEQQEADHVTVVEGMQRQLAAREMEYEIIHDELQDQMNLHSDALAQCSAYQQDMTSLEASVASLQTQLDAAEDRQTLLQEALKDKNIALETQQKEFAERLKFIEAESAPKEQQYAELAGALAEREQEAGRCRKHIEELKHACTLLEEQRRDHLDTLETQRTEIQRLSVYVTEAEQWRSKHDEISWSLEMEQEEAAVRERGLREAAEVAHARADRAEEERDTAAHARESMEQELEAERAKVDSLVTACAENEEHIRRLKELAERDGKALMEMNTQLEVLRERNSTLEKSLMEADAKYQKLLDRSSKEMGHHNTNQRISYIQDLKDDYVKAQLRLRESEEELRKYRSKYGKLDKHSPMRKNTLNNVLQGGAKSAAATSPLVLRERNRAEDVKPAKQTETPSVSAVGKQWVTFTNTPKANDGKSAERAHLKPPVTSLHVPHSDVTQDDEPSPASTAESPGLNSSKENLLS